MKHPMLISLICALLAATTTMSIASPDPIVDSWHSNLQIPTGTLSLVFTISEDDTGALSATMESPDQAPGQQIPASEISLADGHLSIKIAMIGASIETDWDEQAQHFSGTFVQGINLPIIIKRGLPAQKETVEGLDGDWKATINRNGVDLRLILHIKTTEHGTAVSVDSPDTLAMNISVSDLTKTGDAISYKIKMIDGVFTGTLTTPDTITGIWRVSGEDDLPVTYTRSQVIDEPTQPNRPQVPTKPLGYTVEEVSYANPQADGVTLAATLTLPQGKGPFPAAILISGSGPQDRNETVFGHQPFLVLADHLTKQGIAVLRYDDRGVAQSTGDYANSTSADFATDANAAFAYLLSRGEIHPDAIGFVGHSEGGLIAPIAIHTNTDVAYMVMLAGPGTSSRQIARSQNRLIALSQGTPEEDIAKSEHINDSITLAVAESDSSEHASDQIRAILTPQTMETLGINESQVEMIIAQITTPWTRYFLGYDPADYLPQMITPVLALNGELDIQVPAQENLDGLRTLFIDHPDATITELAGLNHMFQHAKTGAMGEYNDIEETFSPEAMGIIADWINKRFSAERLAQ